MPTAQEAVLQAMHERGEATRPQLAQATGLSLVSVGKAVAALCRGGELRELAEIPSGGGRPVKLYRYNADFARHALIQGQKEGALLHCTISLLDLHGREYSSAQGNFAHLEPESLDGSLAELLRGQRLRSITLLLPPEFLPQGMPTHLAKQCSCRVYTPSPATILAQSEPEGTATVCLQPGSAPVCTMSRHGQLCECGPLQLLPMPADWHSLDYTDRSLVEEMLARLLLIISCTLVPQRITLYTPALSPRLTERIRYNASTKLRGTPLPELAFEPLNSTLLSRGIHHFCAAPKD